MMTRQAADSTCPNCGQEIPVPPEPPVGTWVKDKYGGTHYRTNGGWAAAPSGFFPGGVWSAMWIARGPLVACGPYGREAAEQ